MKYIWTDKDKFTGRWVCKDEKPSDFESLRDCYKIGFDPRFNGVAVICITDGMIVFLASKPELISWLNQKEMIPMPHKWLLQAMEILRDVYEGH